MLATQAYLKVKVVRHLIQIVEQTVPKQRCTMIYSHLWLVSGYLLSDGMNLQQKGSQFKHYLTAIRNVHRQLWGCLFDIWWRGDVHQAQDRTFWRDACTQALIGSPYPALKCLDCQLKDREV